MKGRPLYVRSGRRAVRRSAVSRLPALLFVGSLIVINYFVFFRGEDAVVPVPHEVVPAPASSPAAPAGPEAGVDAEAVVRAFVPPPTQVFAGELGRGDRVLDSLARLGLDTSEVRRVVGAMEPVFDFRGSRPGDHFRAEVDAAGRVDHFEYARSPLEVYVVERSGDKYVAARREIAQEVDLVGRGCVVRGGFHDSVVACLGDTGLAASVDDLLSWSIDLAAETRDGDELRVVVERHLADGQFLRYGRVVALGYRGKLSSARLYHHEAESGAGYYTAQGESAERQFLRSPLKTFGAGALVKGPVRPVLHRYKRHLGVDYPVAKGSPIVAVADGTVAFAGPKGSSGTLVNVRHEGSALSYYAHLSRLAPGVRRGYKVSRGEVIGFSGDSGGASSPRLHYALKVKDRFRNTLEQAAAALGELPASAREAFDASVVELSALLEAVTPYDPALDT